MSMRAFYIPPASWGNVMELSKDEAAHARAARLAVGEEALALDGEGRKALCRVAQMRKKSLLFEILEESFTPRPKALPVIALALSKAARRGFFMEKAAELGAHEIWLWRAARSQGQISPELGASCEAKMIAGIKQCHNPWLPKIRLLDDAESVARAASAADWLYLPWEAPFGMPLLNYDMAGREGLTVYCIGPEGGYEDDEIATLRGAGFSLASLGSRVLRCETAASLCLGVHCLASQLPGRPDHLDRPEPEP